MAPSRDEVTRLRQENEQRLNALRDQGVHAQGRDGLVRDVYLEHILRTVGGRAAVLACELDVERRISLQIDMVEQEMPDIRLAQAAETLGLPVGRKT